MNRGRAVLLALLAAPAACTDDPPVHVNGAPAPDPGTIRFEECAEPRGLRFFMAYLPNEQGEKFKVNFYDHGAGLAVADYDGDGSDDVLLLNQLGPCGLFRNRGDGSFEDTTKAAGDIARTLDGRVCVAAAFADTDNDGDQDLYVTTTRAGNAYFENVGGGKFRDATKEAGLTLVIESETPCFFDVDGDGDQDLFVTNNARWTLDEFDGESRYFPGKAKLVDVVASAKHDNILYRNDGKGRFTDITAASNMKGRGWGGDTAVFDADADHDLDIYVGNMFGASQLMLNDGKGVFSDATAVSLQRTSWGAVGARVLDFDNDGRFDLYVADMHSDMWMRPELHPSFVEEKKKYDGFLTRGVELGEATQKEADAFDAAVAMRPSEVLYGNTLFRNLGGGRFEECSGPTGTETFWPWGVADGDFDQDGWSDLFLASGMGYPFFYWRSPVLRNRGDGTFEDVCRSAGIDPPPGGIVTGDGGPGHTRSSRCVATGDFDGDGRLDLVVNNFNDRAFLFRNVSRQKHWLGLRLTGTRSGRDAIGAIVRVTAGGRTVMRQVQATSGYLAQSTKALHFGLGDAGEIERVEVTWPSGAVEVLATPRIDAVLAVTEAAR